jgi:hypothetical protein
MIIPVMNFILSSLKNDLEFSEPFAVFVFFLGDSSFSLAISELSFACCLTPEAFL